MTKEMNDLIDKYYDEDKHDEIVKLIMRVPETERDMDMLGQLIVAYNNLDQYDDAIALSMEIENKSMENISWYYRLSYALIGKEEYAEAAKYIKIAMELAKKGDDPEWIEILRGLYDQCRPYLLDLEKLYEDAENGVLSALKILGDIYLNGYEDIAPNLQNAIVYYEQAAAGGMEEALLELGYIYCSGEYIEPDFTKGIEYYKRAADMGNTTALGNLGMSYCKGYGVEKDEEKGFAYFMKAAEGGHPVAMAQVADMYREGCGVEQNEEKADYWEKRAAEQRRFDEKEEQNENAPVMDAFAENLKFISSDSLDAGLVKYIFEDATDLKQYTMGECEFTTGRIITADPLCYLQSSDNVCPKARTIEAGTYPVQVSVMDSDMVGLRIVGARLKISDKKPVQYELANCVTENQGENRMTFAGFPVECGMGCFCDVQAAESYWKFLDGWYKEHEDGNIYDDYFAEFFAESYRKVPDYQREKGDLLMWSNPLDGSQIAMFASGLGDGFYTDYWGVDVDGEICELVIIFMNPELFME